MKETNIYLKGYSRLKKSAEWDSENAVWGSKFAGRNSPPSNRPQRIRNRTSRYQDGVGEEGEIESEIESEESESSPNKKSRTTGIF